MARPRYPATYSMWRIVLHGISLVLCIAIIAAAGYTASFRYGYGESMAPILVAALWAIGVDMAEIAALADARRRVRRCTEGYLCALELLTTAICVLFPLYLSSLAHFSHGCVDIPLQDCALGDMIRKADRGGVVAMFLEITAAGFHFILFVLACKDYFAKKKGHRGSY